MPSEQGRCIPTLAAHFLDVFIEQVHQRGSQRIIPRSMETLVTSFFSNKRFI